MDSKSSFNIKKNRRSVLKSSKVNINLDNYFSEEESGDEYLKKDHHYPIVVLNKDVNGDLINNNGYLTIDSELEKCQQNKLSHIKKLFNLIYDNIHNRYQNYLNQSDSERENSKTDYTYAHTLSYKTNIDNSQIWSWEVPNMARKSIQSHTKISAQSNLSYKEEITMSKSSNMTSNSSLTVNDRSSPSRRIDPNSPFTRSQCLGGKFCVAGCEIHKKVRRRNTKSVAAVIPHSGKGLEPLTNEFSDDEETSYAHMHHHHDLHNSKSNRQNGHSGYVLNDQYEDDESIYDEEEEITLVKRITNVIRTSVYHTNQMMDTVTPKPLKRVTRKCPSLWSLLYLLFLFGLLGLCAYFVGYQFSSPSHSAIDSINSDSLTNEALNKVIIELKLIKSDMELVKNRVNDDQITDRNKHDELYRRINHLEGLINNLMKNCCRNETDLIIRLIDDRLTTFVSLLMKNEQMSHLTFAETAFELRKFIYDESMKLNDLTHETIEQKVSFVMNEMEKHFTQKSHSSDHMNNISLDEIKNLIREALAIYDADKTGQPDYALEPAGGTILNTRCSETFDPYGIQYRVFGIPLWTTSISPRAVIQPNISPGECWAFKGSQGFLVIKLSQLIVPTAFSYEHIPKQISRDGNINSAPKEFQIRGLEDESDTKGHLLGNYVYEDNDKPMQYFLVQDPNPRAFRFIELIIVSNHGHHEYTCLYRFRVHGKRVDY